VVLYGADEHFATYGRIVATRRIPSHGSQRVSLIIHRFSNDAEALAQ